MTSDKHILIFSHGFGVRKDDKGLLSEIAETFPERDSVLFDYNEIDEVNKTLTVPPLSFQAEKLNKIINSTKESNPGAMIDLIAHSQGTIVAAMAKPNGIRRVIFLTPPFDMTIERTIARYQSKPGFVVNLEGMSILPVLEGYTRLIPAEYWAERKSMKPFDLYNSFAELSEIVMIEANQDQILEKVDLKGLNSKIQVIQLDGDHNFTGASRAHLLAVLKDLL